MKRLLVVTVLAITGCGRPTTPIADKSISNVASRYLDSLPEEYAYFDQHQQISIDLTPASGTAAAEPAERPAGLSREFVNQSDGARAREEYEVLSLVVLSNGRIAPPMFAIDSPRFGTMRRVEFGVTWAMSRGVTQNRSTVLNVASGDTIGSHLILIRHHSFIPGASSEEWRVWELPVGDVSEGVRLIMPPIGDLTPLSQHSQRTAIEAAVDAEVAARDRLPNINR